MKEIKIDPYFINGQHRITILVVGAGGTGSLLVTKLARLTMVLNHLNHPGLFVKVIDDDIVEEWNIGRQMFTNGDVGEYKSNVLISKINHSFGFDWENSINRFDKSFDEGFNVVISCVDNLKTRKKMINFFYKKKHYRDTEKGYYFIDAGNGKDFGQVVLFDKKRELKNIFEIYPNIKESDKKEIQGNGCSFVEKLNEQDLFINDYVSLYIVRLLKELLFLKKINYQGYVFNLKTNEHAKILIR